jgi:hypothetical protein
MRFNKRSSIKKNYSGGGGGTVSTIPEWAQPYLKNVGNATESAYAAGELGKVAGASQLQQKAFGGGAQAIESAGAAGANALAQQQSRLADVAKSGAYNTQALKDAAILQAGQETAKLGHQYGAGGTLGSARQAVQQGAQNAATSAQFATIDRDAAQKNFENKMLAEKGIAENISGTSTLAGNTASGLANLGNQQRGIDQQGLDATWQGLQRYASTIYGNPARQQATSGGK